MTNENGYNLRVTLTDGSNTEKSFTSYEDAYNILIRLYGMCGSRFAVADIADNDTGVIVYEWNNSQFETVVYLWKDEESFEAFGLEYADVIKATGIDGDRLAMDLFQQKWIEWDEGRGAILEFRNGEMISYDTFGDDDRKVYNMLIAKWEE